jgi:peptidoglycan lytic transglycosylase G
MDPFDESAEARAREERRQEREARRRKRLGAKVDGGHEEPPVPVPVPAGPTPSAPPPAREDATEHRPTLGDSAPAEPPPEITPIPAEELSPWAPRRPPEAPRRTPKSTYRRRRIAVFAVLMVLLAGGIFAVLLYQPFHGSGTGRVAVTIPRGASASEIADLLDQKGVVSNSTFFRLRLSLSGDSGNIQAGRYTLANGMSYSDAIDALTTKPEPIRPRITTVTIPEGYDRDQTAALLKQDGVSGNYMKASESFKGFDPAKYGAKNPANLEGFLFPATYKLKRGQTATDLVGQQLAAFQQQIKGLDLSYARSKNLTTYDTLIIASLIEREAQRDADRPKVAAVIYNRLHDGIPLGIDATIRFIEHNYTKPLTQSDLALDSPYNTRTNSGLPPGPISNPGLASLQAAAKPAKVPYLYYVTKPGACGKLTFATTDAQFQRAVDAYNNARNAAGGKSPTSC